MQPYFFPYAGYFQLADAVDRFVFYDDVNFIKGGWINRNRLIISGKVAWFTVPLANASPNKRINEISVQPGRVWKKKILESVKQSYSKAPNFKEIYEIFEAVVMRDNDSLASIAEDSVVAIARYLGLNTEFVVSTCRYANAHLQGVSRVLDICVQEGALEYHNLPGGIDLYSKPDFEAEGIELTFVQPLLTEYSHNSTPFKPGLSIIDLLMFNNRSTSLQLLRGIP